MEFRSVMRSLGFSKSDSDRVFSHLDALGGTGQGCRGAAYITAKDFLWLLRHDA